MSTDTKQLMPATTIPTPPPPPSTQESHGEAVPTGKVLEAPATEMHGSRGDASWAPPRLVAASAELARPGYDSRSADEYLDTPDVLRAKMQTLAQMLRESQNCMVYTGAGISTASGIGDYASKAQRSVGVDSERPKLASPYDAQPTVAHRCVTALHAAGHVKHWLQQNHDGLPQKAGFPQRHLNEIHGAWYDPSNPVVPMDGMLRGDLCAWMEEWEHKTDLCLVLGTTLCGMNADRVAATPARKAATGVGLGTVIINLQRTAHDATCSLRVFAKIDDAMQCLIEALALDLPPLPDYTKLPDYIEVPYGRDGRKLKSGTTMLDVRRGATLVTVSGPSKGVEGQVLGQTDDGHIRIQMQGKSVRDRAVRVLGRWWLEGALKGEWDELPMTNLPAEAAKADNRMPSDFFEQLGLPGGMMQRPLRLNLVQSSTGPDAPCTLALTPPDNYPVPLSESISRVDIYVGDNAEPYVATAEPFRVTCPITVESEVLLVITWEEGYGGKVKLKTTLAPLLDTQPVGREFSVPPLKVQSGFLDHIKLQGAGLRPTATRVRRMDGTTYVEQ